MPALLSIITFVACACAGVTLKILRLWDLSEGTSDFSLWRYFPLTIGADVLFALVLATLVYLLARRHPRTATVAAVIAVLSFLGLAGSNAISYATTQAPITLQRLLGEDGAGMGDLGLLAVADVVPCVVVVLVGLLMSGALWLWLRDRHVRLLRPAVFALVFGLFAEGGGALAQKNWITQLSEQPVTVMGESIYRYFRPKGRNPDFVATYPKRPKKADWDRILKPATQPKEEETPPEREAGTAKNTILFMAETLSYKHSSFGGPEDTTPNMKHRAASGLLGTRAYSPYCLSIQAIYGTVCSDWPSPAGMNIAASNPRIDCGEVSEVMKAHGVKAGLFHAGNFGFSDKLALLGRRGYDVEHDAQSLARTTKKPDGSEWPNGRWGIEDRAMVQGMLNWVDSLSSEERFMAVMIPISAHYPYRMWEGNEPHFDGGSQKERYLSSVYYLDTVFEEMMKALEARGILDDTLVVVIGDHGESHGEQVHESIGKRLSYETHARVPLIMLHPLIPPQNTDRVVALMDMVPTILDVMGFAPDPRHHGRSIFAEDWQARRVFLAGRGGGAKLVGFVDNDMKFLIDQTTLTPQLYDLKNDPYEINNIAARFPSETAQFAQDAFAWRDWQSFHLKTAQQLGDEVDIHGGAVASAKLIATQGGASTPKVLKRERVLVDGMRRDCFVIQPPEGGSLTLTADDKAWVPEVSQIRIARIQGEKTVPDIRFTVASDGRERESLLRGRMKVQRVEIERPKQSLKIHITAASPQPPMCLTLSEGAWRGKAIRKPFAAKSGEAEAERPTPKTDDKEPLDERPDE